MFAVIAGRGCGKTRIAAQWLTEDPENRILLVASEEAKRVVLRELAYYLVSTRLPKGFWQERVLTVHNLDKQRRGVYVREIGIDDLDQVLSQLLLAYGSPAGALGLITTTATPVTLSKGLDNGAT